MDSIKIANDAYEKGKAFAWDIAKKLILRNEDGMPDEDFNKCFGYETKTAVLKKYSLDQIAEMIKKYEENKITVGDVVKISYGSKAIVISVEKDNVHCLDEHGKLLKVTKSQVMFLGKNVEFNNLVEKLCSL